MKLTQDRATSRWPAKPERELAELDWFIRDYATLPAGKRFRLIERRERPDFVLAAEGDSDTALYGVEITSVYFSDRTVPDVYMLAGTGFKLPSYTRADESRYLERVLEAIRRKVASAKHDYGSFEHLMLGVCVTDFIAHQLVNIERWETFFHMNEQALVDIDPFTEIVVFNLANYQVVAIRPDGVDVAPRSPNPAPAPDC